MLSEEDKKLSDKIRVKLIKELFPLEIAKEFFKVADNKISITTSGKENLKVTESYSWDEVLTVYFKYKNLIDISLIEVYDYICTGEFNFSVSRKKYTQKKLNKNTYIMNDKTTTKVKIEHTVEVLPKFKLSSHMIKKIINYDKDTGEYTLKPTDEYDVKLIELDTGETLLSINTYSFRLENLIWLYTRGYVINERLTFKDGNKKNFKYKNIKYKLPDNLPKEIQFDHQSGKYFVTYKSGANVIKQDGVKTLDLALKNLDILKKSAAEIFKKQLQIANKKSKKFN